MKRVLTIISLLFASFAHGQEEPKTDAIRGVKGVKEKATPGVKEVVPPTAVPPTVTNPRAVKPAEGVKGVEETTPQGPVVPPPPAAQGMKQAEGIQVAGPSAVKPVTATPAGVVSTIRAVEGVQGIVAQKQKNLEAALRIKEDGESPLAVPGKGTAAAAALSSGPPGLVPAPATEKGDGRDAFQQFEKLTAPGS